MKTHGFLRERADAVRRFGRAGVTVLGTCLLVLARLAGVVVRGVRTAMAPLGWGLSALGSAASALGSAASALGPRIAAPARRSALALALVCALLAVRVWLVFRALPASRRSPRAGGPPGGSARPLPTRGSRGRVSAGYRVAPRTRPRLVPRAGQEPNVRLTGRGGVVVMFAACFLGLLIADWANWEELADAVFFMASSLTAYYVRPGSLLPVAVSPPLLFFGAMALEKLAIASGTLAAAEGTLVMLAGAAPWLFAGTALTVGIALLRGLTHEIRALVLQLRGS